MFSRLWTALVLIGTLCVLFNALSNASRAQQALPLYAMKTLYTVADIPPGNGWFYANMLPSQPFSNHLKIEMLFDNPGLTGDQTGGVSPYTTILHWPDGKVDMKDIGFIAKAFGTVPGNLRSDYMADVFPDQRIDMKDIGIAAHYFGQSGTYLPWPQTGVTVKFNDGTTQTPDSNGYVLIPGLDMGFTVYQNGIAIGAMATFWDL